MIRMMIRIRPTMPPGIMSLLSLVVMDEPTLSGFRPIRARARGLQRLAVVVLAVVCFAWLAVVPSVGADHPWDEPVQEVVHDHSSGAATWFFIAVTVVGGGPGLGVLTGVAAVVLALRGRRRPAVALIGGLALSEVVVVALKLAFRRARPTLWASPWPALGWSFPSGHAMTSSAVAAIAVGLLWPTRWRTAALVVAVPAVLLVGLSRVYLGVHYPSDVLAAWCVTAAGTAAVLEVRRRRRA